MALLSYFPCAASHRRSQHLDRGSRRGWIGKLCGLLAGIGLLCATGFTAEIKPAEKSLENKVKAAYLFNFTKYMEWPARAFSGPDDPILIGIIGIDPFGDLLEQTIGERRVGSRKVLVRRSKQIRDLKDSHLLFISTSEKDRLPAILAELKGQFALTISEIPQFSEHNGMITFVLENEVVRFDVNLDNAEKAGLKISARLLNTARNVAYRKHPNRE